MLTDLFTSALGLQTPWQVVDVRFEQEQGRIDFDLENASKRLALTLSKKPFPLAMAIMRQLPLLFGSNSPQMQLEI